ncbi:MAG: biotin/lipoyl-binding protein [Bacteriovoracaceae bacterium]|nr:biotin/lipoyl-binding protein [Bacteriovoracaceae bacterium]
MGKKRVKFMCTAFRDGFQSVFGARVFTKDFLPAVESAVDAGIDYFEAGGGARFQSPYFYCNEDAFDMMDQFRKVAGQNVTLQSLARGVNVVGLESQPSDIIKLHAELFKKHGIDTIRNFDALNDVNNLIYSGRCISEAGLKHQVCVTLMELPPGCKGSHDSEFYIRMLKDILDAGIPYDSVCFKDASGTAVPSKVYETIKESRKFLPEGTFIHFHTHETAGCGVISNQAALDAGADAIDLSLAPVSGGTCQPDVIVMWHALRGSKYDLGIDVDKIRATEEVFKECMKDYFLPPEATAVEPLIPWSPMPGGALTANTQMMRDNNIMDKYPQMIKAMKEVVERGGFGTSVTPVSQFYVQQALNNVMFGKWKKIVPAYGQMVLGYFGKTPVEPDPVIIKIAREQLGMEPTTKTVLEINDADSSKGVSAARKILEKENLKVTDENIFIVATCKDKGVNFLKGEGKIGVRKNVQESAESSVGKSDAYTVSVDGTNYAMKFDGDSVFVNGKKHKVRIKEGIEEGSLVVQGEGTPVCASMPGTIWKIETTEGAQIKVGENVVILESMKMEIPVGAPVDGKINQIVVNQGQRVASGDVLAYIEDH